MKFQGLFKGGSRFVRSALLHQDQTNLEGALGIARESLLKRLEHRECVSGLISRKVGLGQQGVGATCIGTVLEQLRERSDHRVKPAFVEIQLSQNKDRLRKIGREGYRLAKVGLRL